jgi:hypothetical protein
MSTDDTFPEMARVIVDSANSKYHGRIGSVVSVKSYPFLVLGALYLVRLDDTRGTITGEVWFPERHLKLEVIEG